MGNVSEFKTSDCVQRYVKTQSLDDLVEYLDDTLEDVQTIIENSPDEHIFYLKTCFFNLLSKI